MRPLRTSARYEKVLNVGSPGSGLTGAPTPYAALD